MAKKLATSKARKTRGNPQHLPEALKKESPLVKFIYTYLRGRGEVDYSTTSLAEALGCAQAGVHRAMMKLRNLGLMEYEGRPRGKAKYRVLADVKQPSSQDNSS